MDADEIIEILKDIKKEYFNFLISNIEEKNITASYDEFSEFVLHFFKYPSEDSIINYELIITNYKKLNLEKYGITSNDDVNNKFLKLISLFNIIRAIYNMNHALNNTEFVRKMDNYKDDDKNHYQQLLSTINNVWFLYKKPISRANSSTDNQQLHNSVSSIASSSSINPSLYAISSNDSLSIASSFSGDGTILSSNYRPNSRLSTNSSVTANVNSGRNASSSMSEDSLVQFEQNKKK